MPQRRLRTPSPSTQATSKTQHSQNKYIYVSRKRPKKCPKLPTWSFSKLLGQQDSLPGQQSLWESKASTFTFVTPTLLSALPSGWTFLSPPGLASPSSPVVSPLCDPALGPVIPILRISFLLSNPISRTDIDSLQLSEQPGVKSQI